MKIKVKVKINLNNRARKSLDNQCDLTAKDKQIFDELVASMFGTPNKDVFQKQSDNMVNRNKQYGSIQFPNRPKITDGKSDAVKHGIDINDISPELLAGEFRTLHEQLQNMSDKCKGFNNIKSMNGNSIKPEEHVWPEFGEPLKMDDIEIKEGLMSGFNYSIPEDVMVTLWADVIVNAIKDDSIKFNKEQFDSLVDTINSKL